MMRFSYTRGSIFPFLLVASAVLAVAGTVGFEVLPLLMDQPTHIRIEPTNVRVETGHIFTIRILVDSTIPVNVFGGELTFDKNILAVDSIDYNTSIANLWAIQPWYSNGDGTLTFGGGTTKFGGFVGSDTLLTVNFKTIGSGSGAISLHGVQIFQNDGLGTMAAVGRPIDGFFIATESENAVRKTSNLSYVVAAQIPSTDINGDGKQTLADLSLFMLDVATQNKRSDFNVDNRVDTRDLSILLNAH